MKTRLLIFLLLLTVMSTTAFSMTREQAMEELMENGSDGVSAVNIAWGLCDRLDGVADTHLFNVAIYSAIYLGKNSFYTWDQMPLASIANYARLTIAYENEVRALPGH